MPVWYKSAIAQTKERSHSPYNNQARNPKIDRAQVILKYSVWRSSVGNYNSSNE
ncbi:hypothetical protein QUB10_23200 [Microcoleus sp. B5-D4]|uniref:hypothetical protein n=1 Tax=unclassified Microcoleus TaxID=2642155 RepID=UPI002FD3CC22